MVNNEVEILLIFCVSLKTQSTVKIGDIEHCQSQHTCLLMSIFFALMEYFNTLIKSPNTFEFTVDRYSDHKNSQLERKAAIILIDPVAAQFIIAEVEPFGSQE